MTGIIKTDQIQGAQGTTVTVPTGNSVGMGIASPDGTLHVHSGSAGSVTAHTDANDLVVENSSHAGMNILSPDANRSALFLGHASDNLKMQIRHDGGTSLSQIISDDTLTFNVGGGTERMRIDTNGHMTMPTQPAFSATRSSTLANFATNSMVTINLNSEVYDQNQDFSDPNFTAPVTGKYQLSAIWYMNALDISAAYYILQIATSNRNYDHVVDSSARDEDETYSSYTLSVLADMDAGDTASIGLYQQGGAAQTDITAGTFFTGYLVA